jgi:glycosyltransferase involved in cell wall biosynthesis
MKILALSNFYPPHSIGGEELSAQAIVNGLRKREHYVEVLTSNYGHADRQEGVYRKLKLEMEFKPLQSAIRFFTSRNAIIRYNETVLEDHVERLEPDLILIFSMWNIPRHIPALAERLLDGRVIYRLASYWPTLPSQHVHYWQTPAKSKLTWLPKAILSWPAKVILKNDRTPTLQLQHTISISQAVHNEFAKKGIQLPDDQVIHNGIDLVPFLNATSPWLEAIPLSPLKLLYVGRTSPEKGVYTALEALAMLRLDFPEITLTIAGSSWGNVGHSEFIEQAAQLHISDKVTITGYLSHEQIPALMRSHHILLVPSIWPEPFGRVVLEGMAAGMVVIGTGQGGMREILKHNQTGLIFPPENAEALSQQIRNLLSDAQLGNKLVKAAQEMVCSSFTEDRMVDAYEAYFRRVLLQ